MVEANKITNKHHVIPYSMACNRVDVIHGSNRDGVAAKTVVAR